ncbi:MAG: ABC transporter ATP-binding protein, partial [Oscillospiraceae bacterium]|nr:ABC transporter ATP-binding protein [Oscillospiraceae bacterium]
MKKETSKQKGLPFFGIGKVLPYLKKYRKALAGLVLGSLVGSLVDTGVPLFQRYALDHFIGEGTLDTIVPFVIFYLLLICGGAVVSYFATICSMAVEVGVDRDLRNKAFDHLQTLSFSYYNQNSVGYIHARVMSDTQRIGGLVSWTLLDSLWQGGYVIGAVIVMFVINAKLALLVVAVLPLTVLLFSLFQAKLTKANREIRELNSQITGDFNEGITGARTIKTLVIEEKMEGSFVKDTATMRRKSVGAARLRGFFAVTMNFASSLALAIVLWKGGLIAKTQIGTFSMFMS